jgi:hypothetical protein
MRWIEASGHRFWKIENESQEATEGSYGFDLLPDRCSRFPLRRLGVDRTPAVVKSDEAGFRRGMLIFAAESVLRAISLRQATGKNRLLAKPGACRSFAASRRLVLL